jgi:hypothetical protein
MKAARVLLATTVLLVTLSPLYGQETQAGADAKKTTEKSGPERAREGSNELTAGTPLKVQVVISEFDGNQKISTLPYSFNLLGTYVQNRKEAHLRLGVRVPISTGSNSFTYQDVGTNIDVAALQREDGRYRLELNVDRSSVSMPKEGTDWKPGDSNPSTEPLIRSFRDDFTVVASPGESVEGTSAVDPVTGHVLKVEVTLTAAK